MQMSFGGEVPVDGTLADARPFGHRLERQISPVPGVERVHQFAAGRDDALPRLGRFLLTRPVVVGAPRY